MNNIFLNGIPAYDGGKILEAVDVGAGLYDDRQPLESYDTVFHVGDKYTEEDFKQKILDMKRTHRAHLETSKDGIAARICNDMRLIRLFWKDGEIKDVKFLDPEPQQNEDKTSYIRVIRETSESEFLAYIEKLLADGFELDYENKIENNLFRELVKGDKHVYAYYMANTQTARVVDDRTSVRLSEFGYECEALEGEKVEVYQYGHHYGSMRAGFTCDCGMLYIVKLADNSVFIVDGGEYEQSSDCVVDHIMQIIRNMTKTPEGEKVRVAGALITHAHDDHMDLFSKLLRVYHDELSLERVIFNFTARDHFALMPETYIMIDRINKYYPDVKYLKAHTGQKFMLATSLFEVIQTHEDGIWEIENERFHGFRGFNDTSTVLRIGMDEGKTFVILGDVDDDAEMMMLKHFSADYLKTDIVQVAHHLINLLKYLYDAMKPSVALIPQDSDEREKENNPELEAVRRNVAEDKIYFAYDGTFGFRVENGEIVKFYSESKVGDGVYDGSEI